MLSQVTTWVMTLVLTFYMARALGPTSLGQLQLSASLWGILAVLVTFGMDVVLTKEVARHPEGIGDLIGTTLVLQVLLYAVALGLITVYVAAAGYPQDVVTIIFIIGISSLLYQFEAAFESVLKGLERMDYMSLGVVLGKVCYTAGVAALLFMGLGVKAVALIAIAAPLATIVVEWAALGRLRQIHLRFRREVAGWLLKAGIPFFVSGIFLVLYQNLDVVFISLFASAAVVGWYGAATRLVGTLLFVPSVLEQAIFPALARLHSVDSQELPILVRRVLNWLLAIGVPLGLGTLVISKPVVLLLYGAQFQPSGDVLTLMGIALIFMYVNILFGRVLIATDRQNWLTAILVVSVVATIALDFVFIPWCQNVLGNGAIGGALSFLVTESAQAVAGIYLMPKGLLTATDFKQAARIFLVGGLMVLAIWWLRDRPVAIQVIVGIAVYLPLALVLRVIPPNDLVLFGNLAGGVARRVRARLWSPVT